MARISARVANQLGTTNHVLASVETHGGNVAEAVAAVLEIELAVATAILDGASARLRRAGRELRAAEHAYTAEQADDAPARAVRDAAAAVASGLLQQLGEAVASTLGEAGRARFGLEGTAPRAPAQVAEYAANTVSLLRKANEKASNALGVTFDTMKAAAAVERGLEPLQAAIDAVATEGRELELAMTRRDAQMASWSQIYQGVAGTLEGLYRLAGEPDLAQRIRPSARRLRGEVRAADDTTTEDASATTTDGAALVEDTEEVI